VTPHPRAIAASGGYHGARRAPARPGPFSRVGLAVLRIEAGLLVLAFAAGMVAGVWLSHECEVKINA
jgi:hypothetical protein